MSWARLDDGCYFNAKIVAAGNECFGCHCRLIAWSSHHLTDGEIPRAVALAIASRRELLDEMIGAGLLHETESGYSVHDFLEYNPSAKEVRKQREVQKKQRSAAGKASATKRQRKRNGPVDVSLKSVSTKVQPRPVPSRPDPVPSVERGAALWPEAIGGAADLELAVSEWGWQAGNLEPKVRERVKRLADAAPIARHEYALASAKAESKVPASDGIGRVRYFLGTVEGNRRDAADEASKPRGSGAAPDPNSEGPLPEYLRRNFTREAEERERSEAERKAFCP